MTCCPSANLRRPCPLRVNRQEEGEPGWSAAKRQPAHTHRRGVCATRRGAAPGGWAARRWCTAASCARGRPTGWARAWWPPSGTRSRSPARRRPPCASSSQARPRPGGAYAVRFGGSCTITVPLLVRRVWCSAGSHLAVTCFRSAPLHDLRLRLLRCSGKPRAARRTPGGGAGHSLGGAMAVLAAHDIASQCGVPNVQASARARSPGSDSAVPTLP